MQSLRSFSLLLNSLILTVLVYGSLYPFSWSVFNHDELVDFWALGTIAQNDLLFNIAFLVPYGFLLQFWRYPRRARLVELVLGFSIGAIICLGVQIAQLWLPSRAAQLDDAWANCIGICAGLALPRLLTPLLPKKHQHWQGRDWNGLVLLCLLMLGLILPVAIDSLSVGIPQLMRLHIIEPFMREGVVTASYTLASLLFVVLVYQTLSGHAVSRRFFVFSALMMASALAVDALVPFVWRPEPTALNWLPFALSGQGQSEFYSAAQLLREMAWSGALLWLCLHAGLSWRTSFIGCFAGLTLGELVQIFLVSGWPDITDVVVLCTIALMMRGLEQVLAANAKETCPRVC